MTSHTSPLLSQTPSSVSFLQILPPFKASSLWGKTPLSHSSHITSLCLSHWSHGTPTASMTYLLQFTPVASLCFFFLCVRISSLRKDLCLLGLAFSALKAVIWCIIWDQFQREEGEGRKIKKKNRREKKGQLASANFQILKNHPKEWLL